eukprot:c6539_g1_i1.p1 GENE.c6539_g1_i1~~c6539_g1_i1.p1  ORF type:complete len:464 (-),score=130.05 c6539_g1_i1:48-1439(-)
MYHNRRATIAEKEIREKLLPRTVYKQSFSLYSPYYILHLTRWILLIYLITSFLIFLTNSLSNTPYFNQKLLNFILSIISLTFIFILTILEFHQRSLCSFIITFMFTGILYTTLYLSTNNQNLLETVIIFTPHLYHIIYEIFHFCVSVLVLPAQVTYSGLHGIFKKAQKFNDEKLQSLKTTLFSEISGHEVEIHTIDNKTLSAAFFETTSFKKLKENRKSNNTTTSTTDSPVAILFNSNNDCWECKYEEIKMFLRNNISVLVFNYRCVGKSSGFVSRNGLVFDGEACFQYISSNFNVPNNYIILVGSSLGGAIATEVASFHKGVVLVNDRSFSTLSLETAYFVTQLFGKDYHKPSGRILGEICSTLLCLSGWEINALKSWNSVQSPKIILYHPKDEMIPIEAQLKTKIPKEHSEKVYKLELLTGDFEKRYLNTGYVAHCRLIVQEEEEEYFKFLSSAIDTNRYF